MTTFPPVFFRLLLTGIFLQGLGIPVAQQLSFGERIDGEILTYFSPYREFADQSLLTRANGHSAIVFTAEETSDPGGPAEYRFLIGHSTGTSSGERDFDVYRDDQLLFTFHTLPKMPVGAVIEGRTTDGQGSYSFESTEQDINRDAFGFLSIRLPWTRTGKPVFRIVGRNHESRDWLMVFMYRPGWKINVFPTALVLREGLRRQVNFSVDSPWPEGTNLLVRSSHGSFTRSLQAGYQTFSIPLYEEGFAGNDTIECVVDGKQVDTKVLSMAPVRAFTFHVIHHSHNDIGYSHLQPEVARIQSRNIRSAMRWIDAASARGRDAYWHIESLWAVENFLQGASPAEEADFVRQVRDGHMVLSANYANVLTGLAQPEELDWMTEYARRLEMEFGFRVRNAMITDIPGVSYWGFESYVRNQIPYLALGPNYVEAFADRGDRVGGVIRETGDKPFFWKPRAGSPDSLFVWTAGKGYSYFHNIQDSEKEFKWEQKLSRYVQELTDNGYPYELVQLRYTKNADNGPVDTLLDAFVAQWNERFASPTLVLSSVDKLFPEFMNRYGSQVPVAAGGEISPYWEDGAYSTAQEENDSRTLARNTIEMEHWARDNDLHALADWYPLHRQLVLWHEHTWGAWCSISDPEIFFTTEQWRIKKSFLDSARVEYDRIARSIGYPGEGLGAPPVISNVRITDFEVDPKTGGLSSVLIKDRPASWDDTGHDPFQLVYVKGTNEPIQVVPVVTHVETVRDDSRQKEVRVQGAMEFFPGITAIYRLDKSYGILEAEFKLDKMKNPGKESLHLCLPFAHDQFSYGPGGPTLQYPGDQLPGSNREFICTPEIISLRQGDHTIRIETPEVALVELGGIIDEHQARGAKVWKRDVQPTSPLYLYILNNYWHTNYKAYQEGEIHFHVRVTVSSEQ